MSVKAGAAGGGWDIAQLVVFVRLQRGLESDPQPPHKKPGTVTYVYNP